MFGTFTQLVTGTFDDGALKFISIGLHPWVEIAADHV
jgi:hypothetical protein